MSDKIENELKAQLTEDELNKFIKWLDGLGISLVSIRDELCNRLQRKYRIDVCKLDDKLSEVVDDYDGDTCTYKGVEGYSIAGILTELYGEEICNIVKKLL